jgi:hypothetical protein
MTKFKMYCYYLSPVCSKIMNDLLGLPFNSCKTGGMYFSL